LYKSPLKTLEIGREFRPFEATLCENLEIFDIFGAAFPSAAPIEATFCTAKRTKVPVGHAKFNVQS